MATRRTSDWPLLGWLKEILLEMDFPTRALFLQVAVCASLSCCCALLPLARSWLTSLMSCGQVRQQHNIKERQAFLL